LSPSASARVSLGELRVGSEVEDVDEAEGDEADPLLSDSFRTGGEISLELPFRRALAG
jgi:hypothetical protein